MAVLQTGVERVRKRVLWLRELGWRSSESVRAADSLSEKPFASAFMLAADG